MRGWRLGVLGLGAGLVLGGCSSSGSRSVPKPAAGAVPLGLQMVRTDAQMRKYPFRTLLDFELPNDPVFVRVEGAEPWLDNAKGHTGANSLVVDSGAKSLTVRLGSLTSATEFPGRWTLVGAYFHASQAQRMTASYELDGAALATVNVEIPPDAWTPVLLDLSAVIDATPAAATRAGTLKFTFPAGLPAPLHCDNVVVVDNSKTLVDQKGDSYSVKERGFAYYVQRPRPDGGFVFKMALKTPEASQGGWKLDEVNPVRCRFSSPAGTEKPWILYADGRRFRDGRQDVLGGDPRVKEGLMLQHANPAIVSISGDLGRVNRTSEGDANNDGYAEAWGTYQVSATGPRVEMIVSPRTPNLIRPVFEIAGLPAGKVLVSMEGRLIDKVARLEDGRVLVELPGSIDRATSVSVRVSQ